MNVAICWKEYRQQRAIWLLMAALGVLLLFGLISFTFPGNIWQAIANKDLEGAGAIMSLVMLAYGIVCGAMLMAAEKEERTLVFLDSLPRRRFALWRAKLLAGVLLTLGLAAFLVVVALSLRDWHSIVLIAPFGLDALVWGMLGGVLCRNVLLACVTGIAYAAASWGVALVTLTALHMPVLETPLGLLALKTALAMLGGFASAQAFCQPDLARMRHARALKLTTGREKQITAARRHLLPTSWRALSWLAIQQARWTLFITTLGCVIVGPFVNFAPVLVYPVATLLVGLVCGLAVFVPEQMGRQQTFLGAQRFPPGRIWTVKVAFWALAAVALTALLWGTAVGTLIFSDNPAGRRNWIEQWWQFPAGDFGLFLCLWVIHGFSLGQFFGLGAQQPIGAVIMATVAAMALSALWLPSLLFGGLHLWQVLGVPVFLLLTSRLFMWPWLAGRLYALRPMLGLNLLSLACVLGVAGSVWYRVLEVPDVGEPFDIQEYLAGLPTPEKNEAGYLVRRAVIEAETHRKELELKLPRPKRPTFPGIEDGPEVDEATYSYRHLAYDVDEKGWPKEDGELVHWLELMFKGDWFAKVRRAARLPLGVVIDPRETDVTTFPDEIYRCQELATLVAIRAEQFSRNGEPRRALEQVETILGLSRQLKNRSIAGSLLVAKTVEGIALTAYQRWLESIGPQSELLRKGLAVLDYHHAHLPDPLDAAKGDYLVFRNTVRKLFGTSAILSGEARNAFRTQVWAVAWQAPWERERQDRLNDAVCQAWLRHAQQPYWKRLAATRDLDARGALARKLGLPPEEGPGSRLSPSQWGTLIHHSWVSFVNLPYDWPPDGVARLRGESLVTALALYQAENGRPAEKLDDVVPRYLPSMPVDPFSGRPFHFRVSKGEKIEGQFMRGRRTISLRDGQGLVWSDGQDSFRPAESRAADSRFLFRVPVWRSKK
jgi:hypothetical protein